MREISREVVERVVIEYHHSEKTQMLDELHLKYSYYRTLSMGIIPRHSDLHDDSRAGMCRIEFEHRYIATAKGER